MDQQEDQPPPLELESPPPLVWLAMAYLSAFVGWGIATIVSIGMTGPPNLEVFLALLGLSLAACVFLLLALVSNEPLGPEPGHALAAVLVSYWTALVSSTVTAAAFNILTDPFIDHAVLILVLGLLPALNIAAASAHFLYKWTKQYRPGWFRLGRNASQQTSEVAG